MKATFIYDHRFFIKEDTVYSSGAFTSNSWERYLDHFDRLTVVGHKMSGSNIDISQLNRCDHPKVDFLFIDEINNPTTYLNSLFNEKKELKEIIQEHDACIIRMPGLLSGNAIKICLKLNKAFAVEAVGCPWDSYWNYGKIQAKIMAPFAYWQMRKYLKKAPMVLYVTKYFLQGRYPTNGITTNASNVILNGLEQNRLEQRTNQLENIQGNKFIFGTVGKIDFKTKGHHVAIKALKGFKKTNPNFIWKIVGPGKKENIQSMAKEAGLEENIEIVGKLSSGDEMMKFYDDLHILIHPSLQEGLPRTVIEAMSRTTPVLASSIAGIPELLSDKYLHKPDKHKQLLEQLIYINNNREKLRKMAAENFEKAKEYQAEILEQKRYNFFSKLKTTAENRKILVSNQE